MHLILGRYHSKVKGLRSLESVSLYSKDNNLTFFSSFSERTTCLCLLLQSKKGFLHIHFLYVD